MRTTLVGATILGLIALLLLVGGGSVFGPAPSATREGKPPSTPLAARREAVLRGKGGVKPATAPQTLRVSVLEGAERVPVRDTDVLVVVYEEGKQDDKVRAAARTDGQGMVELDLERLRLGEGRLFVHVDSSRNPRDSMAHAAKPVPGTAGIRAVEIVLEIGRAASGVLVPPPGVPLESVRLWFVKPVEAPIALDGEGRFDWKGWREGDEARIQAAALHEGVRYTLHGKVVAGQEDVHAEWTAARPGDRVLIRVRLRDMNDRPVTAHVRMKTEEASRSADDVEGEGTGELLLDLVYRPGCISRLIARPLPGQRLGRVLREGVSIADSVVELVFPPARTLRGRVVGERDGSVEGYEVELAWRGHTMRGSPRLRWIESKTLDASGAFAFTGLGKLEYVVRVHSDGFLGLELARVLVGPEETNLEITLPTLETLTVRVVDASGASVGGAKVRLTAPPLGVVLDPSAVPYSDRAVRFRSVYRGSTDADGNVQLPGIDPAGVYRMVVVGGEAFLPLEIQGWSPTDTLLQLEQGLLIQGHLLDEAGKPVRGKTIRGRGIGMPHEGATVHRESLAGTQTSYALPSAYTSAEGAFRLGPVRAGRWVVFPAGSEDRGVEVEAGAKGVVLGAPKVIVAKRIDFRVRVRDLRPEDRGTMIFFGGGWARLDADGVGTFRYAEEGMERDIWAASLSGGGYVWEKKVRATSEVLVVDTKQGGTLQGHVRLPAGVQLDSLALWPFGAVAGAGMDDPMAGSFAWTADAAAGTFEVVGMPPGSWSVVVWGMQGGVKYEGEFEASPGDDVVVDLR